MTKKVETPHVKKPRSMQTKRLQRLGRSYSLNLPDELNEIYNDQFLREYRSFSAFIRCMVDRGLSTLEVCDKETGKYCETGDGNE